jgi:hypothetical protein
MRTQALFDRYYYPRAGYVGGTERLHQLCQTRLANGGRVLKTGRPSVSAPRIVGIT